MRPPYQIGGDAAGTFNKPLPVGQAAITDKRVQTISVAESVAVYDAVPSDPVWDVRLNGRHVLYYRAPAKIAVGVPVNWDAPLVIYDPSASPTGELRCWRAVIDPNARTIDTQGWGLFDPSPCGSGLPIHGWGTGCGLSSDAGLIRGWELKEVLESRSRIRHALRIHGPASSNYRLPARKSDQTAMTGLPMGARLKLDATDGEIMARQIPDATNSQKSTYLTRFLHGVCFAARDYGMIVCDGADEWLLPIEHHVSDPYVATVASYTPNGYLSYTLRPDPGNPYIGLPWSKLALLKNSIV